MLLFSITKGNTTVKSDQKFKDVTHISPANSMGQTWATVIAYQLPNNTLLGCFRKGWLCVKFMTFIDLQGQIHDHHSQAHNWTTRWSSCLSLIALSQLPAPSLISPISFSSTADCINPQGHNLWAHENPQTIIILWLLSTEIHPYVWTFITPLSSVHSGLPLPTCWVFWALYPRVPFSKIRSATWWRILADSHYVVYRYMV